MPPSSTQKRYPHLGKAQVDEFCYGKSALRRTRSVPKLDLLAKNRGFPCTQSPSTLLKHIAHIPRPTPAHTPPASRHWHNKANPPHMTQLALLKPQTGVFAAPGRTRLGSKPRERRLASMLTSEKRPLLADTRPLSTIAPVHARPLVNSRPLSTLAPRLRLPPCLRLSLVYAFPRPRSVMNCRIFPDIVPKEPTCFLFNPRLAPLAAIFVVNATKNVGDAESCCLFCP